MNRRGFTLVELVVTIGILLGLVSLASLTTQVGRNRTGAAAIIVTDLIADARGLAASNDGTGSGAVLVVSGTPGGATLRLLINRPLPGYDAPAAAAHFPVQTLSVPMTLDDGATRNFSLAFSPSGRLDVLRSEIKPGAAPIAQAPGCGDRDASTIKLAVGEDASAVMIVLRCADATPEQTK